MRIMNLVFVIALASFEERHCDAARYFVVSQFPLQYFNQNLYVYVHLLA